MRRPTAPIAEVDPRARAAMHRYETTLARSASTPEVIDALLGLVVSLGGRPVLARRIDAHVLPLDISLGGETPILVEVDALSISRLQLERLVPAAVEQAQAAALSLALAAHVPPHRPEDPQS